jgi:hypothetical protein
VFVGAVDEAAVERAASLGVSRIVCSTASADWSRLADELAAAADRVGLRPPT